MINLYLDLFAIGLSIGAFVFLLQHTDFIFEYSRLFFSIFNSKKLDKFFKFEFYENSQGYNNYLEFLSSRYVSAGLKGFFFRLISCFICLNCFLSLWICMAFGLFYYFLVCFFIAYVVYFILFKIKKYIYSNL
jgi:hypothetical protein